jgi:hypothetical protein
MFEARSPTERVCCRFSGITATAYSLRVLALPRWERELIQMIELQVLGDKYFFSATCFISPLPPGEG